MEIKEYGASLVSQQFWFQEMLKTVEAIQAGYTGDGLRTKVVEGNLYMLTAVERRVRAYGCILRRLGGLPEGIIKELPRMELPSAKLVNLIAIMKTDDLLFDFIYEVYREKRLLGDRTIEQSALDLYFIEKTSASESLRKRSEISIQKLKQCFIRLMFEAGLLASTKRREIMPAMLNYRAEQLLANAGMEGYIKAVKGEG